MLVNGQWQKKWDPVQKKDSDGRFIRQSSAFRSRITPEQVQATLENPNKDLGLKLYVAYICPWATRTLIARSLLGLEQYIPISIVEPQLTDFGWRFAPEDSGFPGSSSADAEGIEYIHQLYTQTDDQYTGRATVPVLWDRVASTIINNESEDILRIFNQDLRPLHQSELDLYPEVLRAKIDQFNDSIYHTFNNGVYRAGFASTQQAYEEAYQEVFTTLDQLDNHFSEQQYAVSNQLTESDIRLFVTLVRFDVAYHGLFKTNHKRITDYPALSAYLERLLQIPAFANNTRVDHIKSGYYSVKALNPAGIVPVGPELNWFKYL